MKFTRITGERDICPRHYPKSFHMPLTLGLTRIGAVVFIENAASNNLLTKMGFQKEGILKKYMYQNGKVYDTYVYSFIPEQTT